MKRLMKIVALGLVLILNLSVFSGCGKSETDNQKQAEKNTESDTSKDTEQKQDLKKPEDSEKPVELTMTIDSNSSQVGVKKIIALAEEKLNLKITTEVGPGGLEGDNYVKTRLASGEMTDLIVYNSGALLRALNPEQYFIDISKEDFAAKLDDEYKDSVSIDGATYGVPYSSTQAGAILYSKPIYKELGLEVPTTWEEFIANCEAIKKSGKTALYGAFGDGWTTQLLYLGDHYSVASADPNFAKGFEEGKTKYATNKAGLRSWEKLQETIPYYNEDNFAATYDNGCDAMANGEAGHWVMLTQALTNIHELYGDRVNDIGVFGIPNDDPEDMGLTIWMPISIYGNKTSEKGEAILKFMEFYISDEALNAYAAEILPDGPYAVKGYEIPENAYDAVRIDMQKYFDNGKIESALEFQTPIKGPNCQPITQEVVAGQITALEAAAAYDEDCLKQAIQLGFDWE